MLSEEQAALRRVATLAARGTRQDELFTAVTEEICRLLPVDFAILGRYEHHGTGTVVATWVRNLRHAALEMATCMRAHGVPNFPDPKVGAGPQGGVAVQINAAGGGPNPGSPSFQAAQKICMPIMQKAGGPPGAP